MKSCAVSPAETVIEPLPLPTTTVPLHAVAVTVRVPVGTPSVPENVPSGPSARSAAAPPGATDTETRVMGPLNALAATTTRTDAPSDAGVWLQAHSQSAMQAHRTARGPEGRR